MAARREWSQVDADLRLHQPVLCPFAARGDRLAHRVLPACAQAEIHAPELVVQIGPELPGEALGATAAGFRSEVAYPRTDVEAQAVGERQVQRELSSTMCSAMPSLS